MENLGQYLKRLREYKKFSLSDVKDATGITDSKLSRIENGMINEPSPKTLKKLAEFYETDIISLFMLAGYLDEKSVTDFSKVFQGVDFLTEEEKSFIQQQINLFTTRHA